MITIHDPPGTAPLPYHHGVEVAGNVRTLYVSGQIGTLANGSVPEGVEAQARAAYANMKAVLDAARMSFADLVKVTVFLVDREDRAAFSAVRAEVMGSHRTASSLVYVAGLVHPELRLEIEAIAVQPVGSSG